ncbi:MAG: glycosyltransferase family 2 protein [Thermodesulfobacteriota bacterium]|nr:glycosyltransferase family 2 protein [Thermodesulfobacteriota bacterium]
MPRASLVIPTYGREKVLCDTVRYALEQDFSDYEIIVIDQTKNHTPETEAFLGHCPSMVRVISDQAPSLTAARNRGVAEARGEIVIMIDDDVIIGKDFISEHVKSYVDATVAGVTGRVEQENRYTARVPSLFNSEFLQWIPFHRFQSSKKGIAFRVVGCNFSFRKESALQGGLFDENFIGDAWGEDYDFSFSLKSAGGRIVYAPKAWVFHLSALKGGCGKRERFRPFAVYSRCHNLAYLMEKNRLSRLYYLYLVFYVYWLLFMKREYISASGLQFIMKGHFHFVKGFVEGFKKGRANVRKIQIAVE